MCWLIVFRLRIIKEFLLILFSKLIVALLFKLFKLHYWVSRIRFLASYFLSWWVVFKCTLRLVINNSFFSIRVFKHVWPWVPVFLFWSLFGAFSLDTSSSTAASCQKWFSWSLLFFWLLFHLLLNLFNFATSLWAHTLSIGVSSWLSIGCRRSRWSLRMYRFFFFATLGWRTSSSNWRSWSCTYFVFFKIISVVVILFRSSLLGYRYHLWFSLQKLFLSHWLLIIVFIFLASWVSSLRAFRNLRV